MLFLGYECGLRRKEVKTLTQNDFQLTGNTLYLSFFKNGVRHPKTDAGARTIRVDNLNPDPVSLINRLILSNNITSKTYVFEYLCKTEFKVNQQLSLLTLALQQITGDSYFRFHHLRRSKANAILEGIYQPNLKIYEGVDSEVSYRLIGHTSIQSTIQSYGVFKSRYFEKYFFSKLNGWSGSEISNVTELTHSNVRLLNSSKFKLTKNPLNISVFLSHKDNKHIVPKFNCLNKNVLKITDNKNNRQQKIF